jgi:hypothetical protein
MALFGPHACTPNEASPVENRTASVAVEHAGYVLVTARTAFSSVLGDSGFVR